MFPDSRLEHEYAEESPLHGRLIFILATPESGAHLVVRALDRLPGVTRVPVATNLFSWGFDGLLDHWKTVDPGDRVAGLADLVDEQQLLRSVRRLADALLEPAGDGGDFIVEYSPAHIGAVPAITAVYPDALLLHLVRDGGDVAARNASHHRHQYWPRPAPPRPHAGWLARGAAEQWCEDQRAADAFADEPNYRVARIERIVADPYAFLGWLADGVGIDADDDSLDAAAALLGSGEWTLRKQRPGRPQALLNAMGTDLLEHYDYVPAEVSEAATVAARLELGYENLTVRSREARLNLAQRLRELSVRWASEAQE